MSKIKDFLKSIDAYQENTNTVQKETGQSTFADNIYPVANYNFQADHIIFPSDRFGVKYLLVVVDIATHSFDIEPQKTLDSNVTLKSMERMFTRGYIKKPIATLATDGSTSFKDVFQKYLYENSIYHKVESKGRHTQLAIVNNLIRQLSKVFNSLMNKKEIETGKANRAWVQYVPMVREKLNELLTVDLPDDPFDHEAKNGVSILKHSKLINKKVVYPKPKFKEGDEVHILLTSPENALGKKLNWGFRSGDFRWSNKEYVVESVIEYPGDILFRYLIEGIDNVSYTEKQLKKIY